MIKFIFLVFVCIKISTGYYEGLAGSNNFQNLGDPSGQAWPVPINFGEPQVQRRKPCSHRRNNPQNEQWIPSFRSMITKPLGNDILEPQALKHENENTADESKDTESVPAVEPSLINERTTVLATNPADESVFLDKSNRRSNIESPSNNDEQLLNEDYDCDIDLDSKDYLDSRDGKQLSKETSTTQPLVVNAEQKVIEMLRDCINKKQKYIEDKLNQGEGTLIVGSRRSMGDLDTDNDDSKSVNDDEQATANINEKSSDIVLTNTDDNTSSSDTSVSNKENEASSLRPGKLFNNLQNPAKSTGITDISLSRRMPVENSRVCYACSTSTNPLCWKPNNRTTIKYCRTNQNCITKSFGVKNSLTIIRDCATSCDATSIPGIEPKYESCSVCYKDYCNSAATNNYNLIVIFIISAIKCTF